MISFVALLISCGTPAEPDVQWEHFGAPFAVAQAVPAATVLADPGAHASGPVRVRGELTQVCQKAGCWAVVRDDAGHDIRVTMADHAFGIDKDTVGRACDIEGRLIDKAVDPARLEHYASEGATAHPEAGREHAWELVATAVAVAEG